MFIKKNKNTLRQLKKKSPHLTSPKGVYHFETVIYLDYASTTPVHPEVLKEMQPYFMDNFGNPGSLHRIGQAASATVFASRRKLAELIGADYKEIIFTGSATEANNLALRGVAKFAKRKKIKKPRIIVSDIEHESILETARDLEREDIEVIYLPVDKKGVVDLRKLKASLNERTILLSIMFANNEIGSIQPISEISKIIRDFKSRPQTSNFQFPVFHTDVVQAFQYLDCDVEKLGVDLMTLSAHKIYGPKGIGLLYVKTQNSKFKIQDSESDFIASIITGGGQENDLRSGTENVPAIVGFGKAAELATKSREKELKKTSRLRDYFRKEIVRIFPVAKLNGPRLENRLANNLNISFFGIKADDLLIRLDLAGVSASAGSACSSKKHKPSYVLEKIGLNKETVAGSIRFTLGRETTKSQIDKAIKILKGIIKIIK